MSAVFVIIHFVAFGILMSWLTRKFAHKYLISEERDKLDKKHFKQQPDGLLGHPVEPMYAFDIHCNGFFPMILFFYFGNVSLLSALL